MSKNITMDEVLELVDDKVYFGSDGALASLRYYYSEKRTWEDIKVATLRARVLYAVIASLVRKGFIGKIRAVYFVFIAYRFSKKVKKNFSYKEMMTYQQYVFLSLSAGMLLVLKKLTLLAWLPGVQDQLENDIKDARIAIDLDFEEELIQAEQRVMEEGPNAILSLGPAERLSLIATALVLVLSKHGLCKKLGVSPESLGEIKAKILSTVSEYKESNNPRIQMLVTQLYRASGPAPLLEEGHPV